jgi:hypothetical protein
MAPHLVPLAARDQPADLGRDLPLLRRKPSTSGRRDVDHHLHRPPAARACTPSRPSAPRASGMIASGPASPISPVPAAHRKGRGPTPRRPGEGHHPPLREAAALRKGHEPPTSPPAAPAPPPRPGVLHRPHRRRITASTIERETCFSASDSFRPSNTTPSKARRKAAADARDSACPPRARSGHAAPIRCNSRVEGRGHPARRRGSPPAPPPRVQILDLSHRPAPLECPESRAARACSPLSPALGSSAPTRRRMPQQHQQTRWPASAPRTSAGSAPAGRCPARISAAQSKRAGRAPRPVHARAHVAPGRQRRAPATAPPPAPPRPARRGSRPCADPRRCPASHRRAARPRSAPARRAPEKRPVSNRSTSATRLSASSAASSSASAPSVSFSTWRSAVEPPAPPPPPMRIGHHSAAEAQRPGRGEAQIS